MWEPRTSISPVDSCKHKGLPLSLGYGMGILVVFYVTVMCLYVIIIVGPVVSNQSEPTDRKEEVMAATATGLRGLKNNRKP